MPPAPLIIAKTSDREASVTCKPRSRCTTFAVATFRFGGVGPPKRGPTTVRSAATQREAPDRPSSLDRFSRNTKRDLDILDLAVVAFARRCDRVDSKAAFGFHEHDPILAFCRRARHNPPAHQPAPFRAGAGTGRRSLHRRECRDGTHRPGATGSPRSEWVGVLRMRRPD